MPRRGAACLCRWAWRPRLLFEATECPSRLSAPEGARERVAEVLRFPFDLPLRRSSCAFRLTCENPVLGAPSLTPDAALSKVRRRWPAWQNGHHACLRGYDESPHGQLAGLSAGRLPIPCILFCSLD